MAVMSKRGLLIIVVMLGALAPAAPADYTDTILPPRIFGKALNAPGLDQVDLSVPLERFNRGQGHGRAMWRLRNKFIKMVGDIKLEIEQIDFDPDPMVLLSFTATNTGSSTQTLAMSVLQPALMSEPVTSSTGSVTTQIIDASWPGDGAMAAAPANSSIYTALIDEVPAATLQDDPFSLSAGAGGTKAAIDAFGPVTTGEVTENIGIDIEVEVSPDDIVQVMARFEVVPEPATLALLVCGAGLLLRRRRAR
ncbi:MAG: PEP-CTERM sorting domain-containing protein [Planctomycetota bacterium]